MYQRQVAEDILGWELSTPNTLNSEAMNIADDKALALLQAVAILQEDHKMGINCIAHDGAGLGVESARTVGNVEMSAAHWLGISDIADVE